jgi:hypothetical protein
MTDQLTPEQLEELIAKVRQPGDTDAEVRARLLNMADYVERGGADGSPNRHRLQQRDEEEE